MAVPPPELVPLDLKNASEAEYHAYYRFWRRLRTELFPDDPVPPIEAAIRSWKNQPEHVISQFWTVWTADRAEIVGRGRESHANSGGNAYLAEFTIHVLPEVRRHGLGRHLLAAIARSARGSDRRLLITDTSGRVPAGDAFMAWAGAAKGLETVVNQLTLRDVQRDLLGRRPALEGALAGTFTLEFWDGAYPEEELGLAAAFLRLMNTQPRGTLALEDKKITPQQLREIDAALFARGEKRWTLWARETATGKPAGFTDALWAPNAPDVLRQANTGVFPEYRGRGLARWLKVAMLEKVMREWPAIGLVRARNASTNEAMLNINRDLGFVVYTTHTFWQADIDQIEAAVGERGAR